MSASLPTYSANDALTFAKTMVKSMPLNDVTVAPQIADYVSSMIWMAAPWRWTLTTLLQTPLVAGQTEYTFFTPTDFAYIESAYLTDGSTTTPLAIESYLPIATNPGMTTKVAHILGTDPTLAGGSSDRLRVHPLPPASYTPTLVALYKRMPTKLTVANYANAGVTGIPDAWFWVFQLGVLWMAYHYADDVQRAGMAVLGANGKVQYTGFLGAFMSGLEDMRRAEKLILAPTGEKERG